ncbi:unnamed protein product, partial [Heterotrigona itama]
MPVSMVTVVSTNCWNSKVRPSRRSNLYIGCSRCPTLGAW